jgi:hypothetical protein
MADVPDRLTIERNVRLDGRAYNPAVRRVALALVGAVLVLGLLDVFGQRPSEQAYSSDAVELSLEAPSAVRGGLIYQARFTITPARKLTHAVLQLSPGWLESQTINTIEPSPVAETSRDGHLALTLGTLPAGQRYVLYVQLQVNPTNVGRRAADAVLYDGDTRLLTVHHTLTIYP